MSDEFRDKLRSLHFNGNGMRVPHTFVDRDSDVKHVETVDERTGQMDGFTTVHSSGRVDAHAIVQPTHITSTPTEF